MAHPPAKRTPFGRLLLVQRVTDLGWSVAAAAEAVGVSRATAHRWLRRYRAEGLAGLADRPSRPQTNGKAERFIRTLLEEWAYARLYRTNAERLAALPGWLAFSKHRRPHTALGGRPPVAAVNNVHGKYS